MKCFSLFILILLCITCTKRKTIKVGNHPNDYEIKEVLVEDTNILDGKFQTIIGNQVVYVANYDNGLLDGESTLYISNSPFICTNYNKGKLDGSSKYFNYDGKLSKTVEYNNNRLLNVKYFFDLSDSIKKIFTLKNGNGILVDIITNSRKINSITTYKNGLKNGQFIDFNENGYINLIGKYKDDTIPIDTWFYSSSFYKIDKMIVFNHEGKQINKTLYKNKNDERFGLNAYNVTSEGLLNTGFTFTSK